MKERTDFNEQLGFLKDTMMNQVYYKNALDNKANVLLGVAGVIFGLSLTQIGAAVSPASQSGLIVLIATTILVSLLCIWTIKMPFQKRKFKQRLMCFYGFEGMGFEEYKRAVGKAFDSKDKLVDEYLTEIYGLYRNSIEPKYALVRASAAILTVGLVLGGLLLIAGTLSV
jgi:uncharacterized membrane protein